VGFARGVKKQKGWRGIFRRAKTPLESVEGYARIFARIGRGIFSEHVPSLIFFWGRIRGFYIITIKAKVLLFLYIHIKWEYYSFIGCTFADD